MGEFQEQLQLAFDTEKGQVIRDCMPDGDAEAVLVAVAKASKRLNSTMIAVLNHADAKLDCRNGCDYCCSFKVEVGAEEVFAIKHFVDSTFTPSQKDATLERARANSKLVSTLSQSKRILTNIPCAFLLDRSCSVYSVRPAMCRKLHSTDVKACKQSFDNPADATVSNAEHAVVSAISMTAIAAVREGIKESGFDSTIYDLIDVVVDAFENPKCESRWGQGKKAFPGSG
ncbi:MAG: YkgJ family cysteine cluster protein [Pseudomonadales bacterium]|nr:YkgJ family cysteine cluster protein [Pseudomonadales bacterium]